MSDGQEYALKAGYCQSIAAHMRNTDNRITMKGIDNISDWLVKTNYQKVHNEKHHILMISDKMVGDDADELVEYALTKDIRIIIDSGKPTMP